MTNVYTRWFLDYLKIKFVFKQQFYDFSSFCLYLVVWIGTVVKKKLILDFQKGEKYGRLLPQIIAVSPNFGTLKKVHQNLCIAICWFYELLSF